MQPQLSDEPATESFKDLDFPNVTFRRAWKDLVEVNNTLTNLREVLNVPSYDDLRNVENKAPAYPSASKLKAIMARGTLWAALASDTPDEGQVFAPDDGRIMVIMGCFDLLWGVISVAQCSTFAYLRRSFPPRLWADIFRWVEYLHPIHGRVLRSDDPTTMDPAFAIFKALDCVSRSESDMERIVLETPVILPIFLDCWLHYPVYVNPNSPDKVAHCTLIIKAMAQLYRKLKGDLARSVLLADLRRLCGGRNVSLWRKIGSQTAYLAGLKPDSRFEWMWASHFELARNLTGQPAFVCEVIPTRVVSTVIAAARQCLSRRQWYEGAKEAAGLLHGLIRMSDDHRTLVRIIHAGVLPFIREIGITSRSPGSRHITSLSSHIAASFWLPRSLRALRAQIPDLRPDEVGVHDMSRPLDNYDEVLAAYGHALKTYYNVRDQWKYSMPCMRLKGPHNRAVRVCPCGKVFYCSAACQRERWGSHRSSCTPDPWGMEGKITLEDVVHINTAAQRYLDENREAITKDSAHLPTLLHDGLTATLTLNFCQDGNPAHVVHVHNITHDMPGRRTMFVMVRFWLGGQQCTERMPFSFDLTERSR
ncbi:hypothetical protein BD626DRAFT_482852 [Schizophyllum amplum]|uniref:MYND-type domain-containing protein n=1 Tax=Schizophyllum amplum TaxID=97359 RepID=A0A550CNX8_9AGAR|nr:hypothetical protein BD626DRAFT_482852 [Auriculariopsis ampla]